MKAVALWTGRWDDMRMAAQVELTEVRDFLARHEPFSSLPRGELDRLPRQLSIEYFRRGSRLLSCGRANDRLFILRSGAADVHDADGSFVDRGGAGACFGADSLAHGRPSAFDVTAIEDALALTMPADVFRRLTAGHEEFGAFFDAQRRHRMRGAVATLRETPGGGALLSTGVRDLLHRKPVTVGEQVPIRDAAQLMAERSVSSLLVVDGARLVGILTDRDLRSRVVAAGTDPASAVAAVMTRDPVTTTVDALAFEVLLTMVGRGIHHLPVVDRVGAPLGMVTTTDIVRLEQANPVYLTGEVAKRTTVAGVAESAARLPAIVAALVSQDATADGIGRIVTALGDGIERRLIELAHERSGPAPTGYAWVALGSRARLEQALAADQDHALILDDAALDPATGEVRPDVAEWFALFAEDVAAGLERCGYPRCTGDVMATNPRWRQPLSAWRRQFSTWLSEPTPDAVLRASIFFDLRHVAGDPALTGALHDHALARAPGSASFLTHLAAVAVRTSPPIGFFRGFVLEKGGEHEDRLEIKRGGIGSVVELARVHALALGSPALNTRARIDAAESAGVVSAAKAADLRDAFEYISYVRIRHQTAQIRAGQAPDNYIRPDDLSGFDKRHLREAFGVIRDAQTTLGQRFSTAIVT